MGVWGVLGPLRNGENHALGTHKKAIEFVFNPEVIMLTLSPVGEYKGGAGQQRRDRPKYFKIQKTRRTYFTARSMFEST